VANTGNSYSYRSRSPSLDLVSLTFLQLITYMFPWSLCHWLYCNWLHIW